MCAYFAEGCCKHGDVCTYAHSKDELVPRPPKPIKNPVILKRQGATRRLDAPAVPAAAPVAVPAPADSVPTAQAAETAPKEEGRSVWVRRRCMFFAKGQCNRGTNCRFSHKPVITSVSPCYKTVLCDNYEENGECPYGDRCTFAHGDLELRDRV